MLRDALSGASSRKSMNVDRPSASRISMNPPPPMLPANGCVTAIANPTATAASTALPPFCSTDTPTSAAIDSIATTMPCCARTGWRASSGTTSVKQAASSRSFFIVWAPIWVRRAG